MAYIGRNLEQFSNVEKLDVITPATATGAGPYNLTQNSTAFTPVSANSLVISIDGVIQYGNFSVNNATVTFDAALSDANTCDFIYQMGIGLISTPADDTVSTAKLEDGAVTGAKVNSTFDVSAKTVTLPASVSGLGTGITNAQLAGSIDVTSKITGVVPSANLGSGTGSSANFLRGDSSWQEVATGTSWQSVVTASTLTAVAGNGYPIDTTSNACTVTLPASASVGDEIVFTDYARNFATNALTINPNSLKYQGNTTPQPVYDTTGESIRIVYMDTTKGWIPINDGAVALETPQTYDVEYLVVAGGGAGGYPATNADNGQGGGGAGGLLTNYEGTAITLTASLVYTITVGEGGASNASGGNSGEDSVISGAGITTITAVGGGVGAADNSQNCAAGGSGGGAKYDTSETGCAGTAGQGYKGGNSTVTSSGGGGGGAGAVGANNDGLAHGAAGGNGLANSITGSSVTYAGGGGGGGNGAVADNDGGTGGGGDGARHGSNQRAATQGTDGLGGGGGAGTYTTHAHEAGKDGGNGIVILRMADAKAAAGTAANEDSTAADVGGSGETVITWLVDGTWTA